MDQTTYTLCNGRLSACIDSRGGELRSLRYDGTELIWQGDPAYWDGSAPLLFPFCGRCKDGTYRWQGKDYPMPIHGFLPTALLSVAHHSTHRLTLTLTDSPETRAIYPFSFRLTLAYQLTETDLLLTATVQAGDTSLPFSLGAHPGFCLPVDETGFADSYLQFSDDFPLTRLEITEKGLLGDHPAPYPLKNGILPLSPDPAGGCGIFFRVCNKQRTLTLKSAHLPCDIRMEFRDFPILGLWHAQEAPYLCIEPWQGLPAPDDTPTDLAHKPETVLLAPHTQTTLTLQIHLTGKGTDSCHV